MDYFNERHLILNLSQIETTINDPNENSSFKSHILNFANNNLCLSTRPSSPTPSTVSTSPSNMMSRTISDSILSNSSHQSYLTLLQTQFKNTFFRLSRYAAVGVGSVGKRVLIEYFFNSSFLLFPSEIGVLVLGAVYMKKRI